jgi:hypothetical protein
MVFVGALALMACRPHPIRPPGDEFEKLIWQSDNPTPGWVAQATIPDKGGLFFVGQSYKYSDDKDAKEDAAHDAIIKASEYISTAVKENIERIKGELNTAKNVIDPSVVSRGYYQFVSQTGLRGARTDRYYSEKWVKRDSREVFYRVFAKSWVPDNAATGTFSDYMNQKQKEWDLTQDQLNRVDQSFKEYYESKKPKE